MGVRIPSPVPSVAEVTGGLPLGISFRHLRMAAFPASLLRTGWRLVQQAGVGITATVGSSAISASVTAPLACSLTVKQRTVNARDAGSNPARSASAPQVLTTLRAAPGGVQRGDLTIIPPPKDGQRLTHCRTGGVGHRVFSDKAHLQWVAVPAPPRQTG